MDALTLVQRSTGGSNVEEVIPFHGGKWLGTTTAVKDTGGYVRVVPRTYSTRTMVPLRAVRLGEATTCISREDTYLQLEDKDITIVTGKVGDDRTTQSRSL